MKKVIYENPSKPWRAGEVIPVSGPEVRTMRLGEVEYYVPENPYAADDGFLVHSGGPMPEWVRGKRVDVYFRDGSGGPSEYGGEYFRWEHVGNCVDILAYRVVGEIEDCEFAEGGKFRSLEQRVADLERRLDALEKSTGQAVLNSMRF